MQSLIGNNEHSWGWDLGRNKVYHDSKNQSGETYPNQLSQDETFASSSASTICALCQHKQLAAAESPCPCKGASARGPRFGG